MEKRSSLQQWFLHSDHCHQQTIDFPRIGYREGLAITALRILTLSELIRNEMARLNAAGHHLLPLGGGADGKAPLLHAWTGLSLTLRAARRTLEDTGLLPLVAAILAQLAYGEEKK